MVVSEVISLMRLLLNDPSSSGRWSDTSLMGFVNEAGQALIRDVQFPQSRLTALTNINQQEYPLPELIYISRVYLAGQIIVPTTIATLEGRQIGLFDQGSQGDIMPPVPGGGGPAGDPGTADPGWADATPQVYPYIVQQGFPAPDAQPYNSQYRPRYYMRGGSIGFVPAPASQVTMTIDCLQVPPQLTSTSQLLPFPENFKRALAWKAVEYAKFSDDDSRATDQRNAAAQNYETEMRKLRFDQKRQSGEARGPKLLTYRSFYQKGNNRGFGGDGSYGG